MADVVITLPVRSGAEDELFGSYFNRFLESRCRPEPCDADAPFVMLRSDPAYEPPVKTVIFQEHDMAAEFSSGWRRLQRSRAS